jgi:predicted SprT family Zn-dependent metalloprotease
VIERFERMFDITSPRRSVNGKGAVGRVLYRASREGSDSTKERDAAMQITDARRMARSLMDEHGLTDWRLVFDNAKTRAGVCRPSRKEIGLSRALTQLHPEAEVRDTVLHEIAHALVGTGHGHDAVWRAKALAIGCSGTRCVPETAPRVEGPWKGTCPAGHVVTRHRRPERVMSCRHCASSFDATALLRWTWKGRTVPMHPRYLAELEQILARQANRVAGQAAALGALGPLAGGSAGEDEPVAAQRLLPRSRPPLLPVGATVRIGGTGKYSGLVGKVVKRGRTRYHVQVRAGVLTVPFDLVEAG